MGSHHEPVDIDPQALNEARGLWNNFTKMTTIGVVVAAATLALMALFLV